MRSDKRSWLVRTAAFLGFWLILFGLRPADFVVAALAALGATWVSLRLLSPGQFKVRPVALIELVLRFLYKSIVAGIDVARRALDPRLPLRPGFVIYHTHLLPGLTRSAFCAETSLLPGTLSCGSDEKGGLVIHCLDVTQPVVEQLAAEETLCTRALGGSRDDD
jgi:multicomponent Na+:H+ antiporter subunit E